jgi:hypothetical protein
MSTIKLKRSSVPNRIPTVEQLDLGEIAINTHDGKFYIKQNKSQLESIVEFIGNVPVKNTVFVQKNGSDSNNGESWSSAFLTIEKALEIAATREETTLIDIGPGIYETQGSLDMPDNTLIRAAHRSVVIKPETGYEERNVFRMGSGCFIEGPIFEGWRLDSLDDPTVGFAVCFRPGALITRTPYVHKVVVRTNPYWTSVAPPLNRNTGNPLVGRGAGVVLADASVLNPNSIYPSIMTWGATPVSHNGIGYVAKNGGLINAVNAVSIWAHKHFFAIDGGQIILSSCSTQFGDYTMVSKGDRTLIKPLESTIELTPQEIAAEALLLEQDTIIDNMWDELVFSNYTIGWTEQDEVFTKRDAGLVLQSLYWVLLTGNEKPWIDLAKGFFDTQGNPVFNENKLPAFVFAFEFLREAANDLPEFESTTRQIVLELFDNLIATISDPVTVKEPSVITAIGHTWTGIMAGVALTKIPPARNQATIQESILELNNGVVIASGQDDQGSALFIGGLEINADTGELSGPPFDQAVNRIATRAAIARSF